MKQIAELCDEQSTSSDPFSPYVNLSEKSSNEDRSNSNNNKDISKAVVIFS